tara:strand:+ start:319 stop:483 length:165 start_codon:yes stop_codon:yes gene_type:complete
MNDTRGKVRIRRFKNAREISVNEFLVIEEVLKKGRLRGRRMEGMSKLEKRINRK